MMRQILWSLAFIAAILAPARAEETYALRTANYLPSMSVAISKLMEPWLLDLEKLSHGRLIFRRYWGGSLGRGPFRQYLLVEKGIVDIGFLFLPMHAGRFPDAEVLEMPLMFNSSEQASTIGWHLFEEGLMRGFENVKVLGIFTTAPGRLFTASRLGEFDKYKGLKLRAAGPVQASYVTALGATPEIIDAATATDALRRGTIDGLIQGWTGMAIFRQTEVTDYFFDLPVGVLPFAIVMNKARWESLPRDLQIQIMELSGSALSHRAGRAYDTAAKRFRQKFIANGSLKIEPLSAQAHTQLEKKVIIIESNWANQDSGRAQTLRRVRALLALSHE